MACVQSGMAREVHMPLGTEPRMSFCCKQPMVVGGGEGDVRPTGLCTLFPLYFMEHRKGLHELCAGREPAGVGQCLP